MDFSNSKSKEIPRWGVILCTDSYFEHISLKQNDNSKTDLPKSGRIYNGTANTGNNDNILRTTSDA